jgi:hypothetical protein
MNPKRWKLEVFDRCLAKEFAFLTSSLEFLGPERQPGVAVFYAPRISVEVALDPREGVLTLLVGQVGEHTYRAELSCLYVAAGLGPAQDVHHSATSTHTLSKSLASQAAALSRLLPSLTEDRREDLLRGCHGR